MGITNQFGRQIGQKRCEDTYYVNIEVGYADNSTRFHGAAQKTHNETAKILMKQKATTDQVDANKKTSDHSHAFSEGKIRKTTKSKGDKLTWHCRGTQNRWQQDWTFQLKYCECNSVLRSNRQANNVDGYRSKYYVRVRATRVTQIQLENFNNQLQTQQLAVKPKSAAKKAYE
ncbi:hypothetical protein ZIOFF_060220 [Zingiber officinale]|uniref:Uncharacterized protein n=1 Tax=Zingiber officinale TaxID=94328 RepID=A0A8J5KL08_ZINOF|nr:hypothetical protein ZIOFF_060220 [Zingiber officinale]